MVNLQEKVGAAAEGARAAAAAMAAAATADGSAELEALATWQAACGGWQQAQPPPRVSSATLGTPQRPRAPVWERPEINCDVVAGCRGVQSGRHDQHRSPPRERACAAAERRRSPAACTFATPLVSETRLVLISPSKLGRRPAPKSGGSRQRRILQSIHSGNASCLFKRSATEIVGDGNVGCRPTKELRWSMQSAEPSYMDAQQPYREAALIEAEITRENGSELTHGDWPV